jgi:hypothetical protein
VDELFLTAKKTANYNRLPVRPRPIEGEATLGYIARVTGANGYDSPRQLWQALLTVEKLGEVLDLSVHEFQCLVGVFPGYWGNGINNLEIGISDFNHTCLRWCPLCLMDSAHIRGIWLLKLACVCTTHKIYLHECCQRCGQTQGLEYPNLDRCLCGTKLTAGAIKSAEPRLIGITHAIEQSFVTGKNNIDLPILSTYEWIKLATCLGQFTETSQPERPGKIAYLHRIDVTIELMSNLALLLDDWPDNFKQLLKVTHRRESNDTSLRRTFGKLFHVLYKQLHEPSFQFLRDSFEDYVQQHWEGVICKRNRSFKTNTIKSHPQLTIKQVAKYAGTEPSLVRHLIQTNVIPCNRSKSDKGRQSCAVNKHQISRIASLGKYNFTLKDAATLLGIQKRRLRLLIGLGVIKPLIPRKSVQAASWQISKPQLDRLVFKPAQIIGNTKVVAFDEILRYWRLQDDEFITLVFALIGKELIPVSGQPSPVVLGKIKLDFEQFRDWLDTKRLESTQTMSVDSAAKHMGLKQQVTYGLVKNGLLGSAYDNSKGFRISVDQIKQFQETYIPLVVLARNKNSSPRKLLSVLVATPVTGPSIDGSRQYFYRREELPIEITQTLIQP